MEWISVKDGMPPDDKAVLVFSKPNDGKTVWRMGIDKYLRPSWYKTNNVTHWMPLPEPPKQ